MRSTFGSKKITFLLFIPILILAGLAVGCGSSDEADTKAEETGGPTPSVTIEPTQEIPPPADEEPGEAPAAINIDRAGTVLADFLSAAGMHLKGEYSGVYTNGMKDGPTQLEIWKKGEKIRIDDARSDGPRSLIVSNGKAIYYMYNTKHVIPSIMPTAYYTGLLGQDFSQATSRISGDGQSALFSFEIDAFYKNDAAQKGYYVTKIEYGVDNDSVLYQVVYGKDSYGTKPSAVNTVTQIFSVVEIDKGVNDNIFDVPF